MEERKVWNVDQVNIVRRTYFFAVRHFIFELTYACELHNDIKNAAMQSDISLNLQTYNISSCVEISMLSMTWQIFLASVKETLFMNCIAQ